MEKNNIIYGIRAVIEALKSGKEIDKVLVKVGLKSELYSELNQAIKKYSIAVQYVPGEKLDKITSNNHQGVIGYISEVKTWKLDELVAELEARNKPAFYLILANITDVRNFGAIARTAECAGVDGIIIPDKGSARISADAIKTSAGALITIPVCRENSLWNAVEYLQQNGIKVIAVTEKAKTSYTNADYNQPLALLLGAEDKGIPQGLIKISDEEVKIEMQGKIESLNVSVAAGVLMFEVVKQRISPPEEIDTNL